MKHLLSILFTSCLILNAIQTSAVSFSENGEESGTDHCDKLIAKVEAGQGSMTDHQWIYVNTLVFYYCKKKSKEIREVAKQNILELMPEINPYIVEETNAYDLFFEQHDDIEIKFKKKIIIRKDSTRNNFFVGNPSSTNYSDAYYPMAYGRLRYKNSFSVHAIAYRNSANDLRPFFVAERMSGHVAHDDKEYPFDQRDHHHYLDYIAYNLGIDVHSPHHKDIYNRVLDISQGSIKKNGIPGIKHLTSYVHCHEPISGRIRIDCGDQKVIEEANEEQVDEGLGKQSKKMENEEKPIKKTRQFYRKYVGVEGFPFPKRKLTITFNPREILPNDQEQYEIRSKALGYSSLKVKRIVSQQNLFPSKPRFISINPKLYQVGSE